MIPGAPRTTPQTLPPRRGEARGYKPDGRKNALNYRFRTFPGQSLLTVEFSNAAVRSHARDPEVRSPQIDADHKALSHDSPQSSDSARCWRL